MYKCGDCGKSFTGISELETHANEIRYECVKCQVSFPEIWELKIHDLRHRLLVDESNQNDVDMMTVKDEMNTINVKVEQEEIHQNTSSNETEMLSPGNYKFSILI